MANENEIKNSDFFDQKSKRADETAIANMETHYFCAEIKENGILNSYVRHAVAITLHGDSETCACTYRKIPNLDMIIECRDLSEAERTADEFNRYAMSTGQYGADERTEVQTEYLSSGIHMRLEVKRGGNCAVQQSILTVCAGNGMCLGELFHVDMMTGASDIDDSVYAMLHLLRQDQWNDVVDIVERFVTDFKMEECPVFEKREPSDFDDEEWKHFVEKSRSVKRGTFPSSSDVPFVYVGRGGLQEKDEDSENNVGGTEVQEQTRDDALKGKAHYCVIMFRADRPIYTGPLRADIRWAKIYIFSDCRDAYWFDSHSLPDYAGEVYYKTMEEAHSACKKLNTSYRLAGDFGFREVKVVEETPVEKFSNETIKMLLPTGLWLEVESLLVSDDVSQDDPAECTLTVYDARSDEGRYLFQTDCKRLMSDIDDLDFVLGSMRDAPRDTWRVLCHIIEDYTDISLYDDDTGIDYSHQNMWKET